MTQRLSDPTSLLEPRRSSRERLYSPLGRIVTLVVSFRIISLSTSDS